MGDRLRILLTGGNGQVGWELRGGLCAIGDVTAPDRNRLDLSSPDSIRKIVREVRPGLIVNAGAYTAVDEAESDAEMAMAVNGTAPGILAGEAKRMGAAIIHYSTDYVFDGSSKEPYREDDRPSPINVYGRTKLAGEAAVVGAGAPYLIFRTSWVYGARGKNFLLTVLRLARETAELRIVDDQIGAPTWSRVIAGATCDILQTLQGKGGVGSKVADRIAPLGGIYNLASAGATSWYDFARAVIKLWGQFPEVKLTPIATLDYHTPACRPSYSVLLTEKLRYSFGIILPPWEESLASAVQEIKAQTDNLA